MNEPTNKELADELDARTRLIQRGFRWKSCSHCNGVGTRVNRQNCIPCNGRGGKWIAPLQR